jgi:hypothetical protein
MGPQDASDRIWLKQSVQFSVAGQVRTIEIALPVRPGASSEEIERLLRQADAGLDQMTQHLTSKVNALLDQGNAQAPSAAAASPRRSPRIQDVPEPETDAAPGRAGPPAPSTSPTSALADAAGDAAHWSSSRSADAVFAPAGLPLERKQFIAEIAVLGLNPRQAMERLGLSTLEGVNLRQALEQLRLQLLHERSVPSGDLATQAEDAAGSAAGNQPSKGAPPPGALRRPSSELKHASLLSQVVPAERLLVHTAPENDLLGDEEEPSVAEAPAEQAEQRHGRERAPAPIPIRSQRTLRSLQEQAQAQALLERLRRIRGRLNPPNGDNLKAFRYVVEEQIGAEKTTALLQAVWQVPAPERLSLDQVAECIRWGKDDHFEDEVDLLLKLTASEES